MLADLFCKLEGHNNVVAVVRLPRSVRNALGGRYIADGKLWGATVRTSKSERLIEVVGEDVDTLGRPPPPPLRGKTLTSRRP